MTDFLITVAYIAVIGGLLFLAFKAISVFLPFILALLFVALLHPIVRRLDKRLRTSKRIISVIVIALLYIVVVALAAGLVIGIFVLLEGLFTDLPAYYNDTIKPSLNSMSSLLNGFIGMLSPELGGELKNVQNSLVDELGQVVSSLSSQGLSIITRFIAAIPRFVVALVFTVMLSFFISFQYDSVTGFFKSIFPKNAMTKFLEFTELLKGTVVQYSIAVLKLMFITFLELTVGLFILGVDNPVGVAAGIALFDALPVFGTGGIMIPWIIIELLQQNFIMAGGLAILYAIVTLVRNIIEPKIVGDQLELNPIISLVSIYAGFRLFSILGMILFPILVSIVITLYRNGFFEPWLTSWKKFFKAQGKVMVAQSQQPEEDLVKPPDDTQKQD